MTEQQPKPAERVYEACDAVVFHRTREIFGGLSNMAAGYPLHVAGRWIPTSEALYQACRFPFHPDLQLSVVSQRSPMTAKMKSKASVQHTRDDWLAIRHKAMRWCLQVKLAQHFDTFGQLLVETGALPIVERSRKDRYWGAILDADGRYLRGRNVLGRLLMELRERLKAEPPSNFVSVSPPDITNFLLFGLHIGSLTFSETAPNLGETGQVSLL